MATEKEYAAFVKDIEDKYTKCLLDMILIFL